MSLLGCGYGLLNDRHEAQSGHTVSALLRSPSDQKLSITVRPSCAHVSATATNEILM
jgi:hypothetical protein